MKPYGIDNNDNEVHVQVARIDSNSEGGGCIGLQ